MGLGHSPRIVTDGLVFCTDMGNTKSWKGKPTTNIVPSASAFSGWTNYYRTLARTSITTEFGTTGWRFSFQPSWSGIYYVYTLPSTGTYTFSAYYRYLGGTASNNGGTVYITGWGGNDTVIGLNKNLVGVWQRVQLTLNATNLSGVFYLISYGGTDSGTTSPDNTSFEVTMPQIEAGSFATPFVDGTRSTTQALLDLTGKRTVTASDLTYVNDNTFSFNGSTNYISVPNTEFTHGTSNFTYNCWVKFAGKPGAGTIFENGSWTNCILIRYETSGITIYSMGSYYGFFSFNPTLGIWYNLTFVREGNNILFYVNGVYQTSISFGSSLNIVPSPSIMYVGMSQHAAGQCFNGNIGIAQVYTAALNQAQISQNFNALRGRFGL